MFALSVESPRRRWYTGVRHTDSVVSERFPPKVRPELVPTHPRTLPRAEFNGTIGIDILSGNPLRDNIKASML